MGIENWELGIGNGIIFLPPVPLQGGVRGGFRLLPPNATVSNNYRNDRT
ncbi:MAG: hypothetical protein F6K47_38325 [Symploca sp. SIO2E6]|nr:hypothetical protein [Symploca sp. SIO2E6]